MAATKRAVDMTNVKDPGNEQWIFTVSLAADGRSTYPYYCGFDDKAAWKIRNLCIAAGLQVPKKKIMIDPNKLVGKEIGITLEDDEYDGKMKSVIRATFPTSELSGDEPSDDGTTDDTVDETEELDLEEI